MKEVEGPCQWMPLILLLPVIFGKSISITIELSNDFLRIGSQPDGYKNLIPALWLL
jgi:hypothetical protein